MTHHFLRLVSDCATSEKMRGPDVSDVALEAARRKDMLGYRQHRARELARAGRMPPAVHYAALQIDFVADRLSQLSPIPADFRSDIYWPGPAAEKT